MQMKRKLFIITFVFFINYFVTAQWTQTFMQGNGGIGCLLVNGSNLYSGWGNGVVLSTNDGLNWADIGLDTLQVNALAISGNNLFAGVTGSWGIGGGVYLSNNNGSTLVRVGLDTLDVIALAINGNNLFAGAYDKYNNPGEGVFLSTDNGATWKAVNNGLANLDVSSLVISGTNLFAGTEGGGIFLSADTGKSWTVVNSGLNLSGLNLYVRTLIVNGSNLFAGNDNGVFISNNNGGNWAPASSGLEYSTNHYPVYSLVFNGNDLYAGTQGGGAFLSKNNGGNWKSVGLAFSGSNNIPALAVSGIYLIAGTRGAGIYIAPLGTLGIDGKEAQDMNISIYPNPGKDIVYVTSYSTKKSILYVYDVAGKLMLTQVLQNGKSTIDVKSLAPGTYNLNFLIGTETVNKQLVIIK